MKGSASRQRLADLVRKVDSEREAWSVERGLLRAELEAWRARDATDIAAAAGIELGGAVT